METLFGRKRRTQKDDANVLRAGLEEGRTSTSSMRDVPTISPVRAPAIQRKSSGNVHDTTLTEALVKPPSIRAITPGLAATGTPRDAGAAALRRSVMSHLPEARASRPPDADVERMFADLMDRRDLLSNTGTAPLSSDARQNMMAFSVEKKWTLVYNDLLTEQSSDRERERARRVFPTSTPSAPSPQSTMVLMRNSPEWFIKKFMDGTVTSKHIESLAVTLRTCAIGWLQNFVEAKGTPVLSSFLAGLHSRVPPSEQDLALEYEVLKAFRSLFNSKPGAHDALQHPKCISGITQSLVSTQLSTRKQASDILLFLCHWEKPEGHRLVLQGIDDLRAVHNLPGRFDGWFAALESALDGRGRMGSLVGASDEVRRLQLTSMPESGLTEYVANNMFLINAIVNSDIVDSLQVRVHLRSQMTASGIVRIMTKMRALMTPDLDTQLTVYEKGAAADQEELVESMGREGSALLDPHDLLQAVLSRVQDTRAREFLLSALQHLLLIQREGADLVHSYQLIDSMVSTVAMDRNGAATQGDLESLLGTSVSNVLGRFAEQDLLERTQAELRDARAQLQAREAETTRLRHELEASQGGLVGQLQSQLAEAQQDLAMSRENASGLQRDMDEMERTYVDRILALELGLRESNALLKQHEENANSAFAQFDRQVLRDSLERQVERSRTIRKLVATTGRQEPLPPLDTSPEPGQVPHFTGAPPLPPVPQGPPTPTPPTPTPPPRAPERTTPTPMDRSMSADAERIGKAALDLDVSDSNESTEPPAPSFDELDEWSMQAVLASGMAKNADLQSRMKEVRASRIRRRNDSSLPGTPEKAARIDQDLSLIHISEPTRRS